MAKKKSNTDALEAVDSIVTEAVNIEQLPVSATQETLPAGNIPPVATKGSKIEPPPIRPLPTATVETPAPVKKKRVRIRKKAAKKLSAAIICQNPNITRFI